MQGRGGGSPPGARRCLIYLGNRIIDPRIGVFKEPFLLFAFALDAGTDAFCTYSVDNVLGDLGAWVQDWSNTEPCHP